MRISGGKAAKIGIFVGLAIALSLPLIQVPNVELFTLVVFLSGYSLGWFEGGVVGALSISIYSFFNPYGFPPFPVLLTQILGMVIIGVSGGLAFRTEFFYLKRISPFLGMALFGLVLTLIYDFLTNLSVAYLVGKLWEVMISAVPFSLIHIGSNVIIFAVLTPVFFKLFEMGKTSSFFRRM